MPERRPNILFLMSDQHRWDALGCVQPLVRTPHLDRLAADGVRYHEAICQAPMCVASRYSLMTGLYPSQLGVRFNQQVIPRDALLPVPVLAQRLATAGWRTGGFGKTHWYEHCMRRLGVEQDGSTRGFQERALCAEGAAHMAEAGARLMEDDHGGVAPAMAELNAINRAHIGESVVGYRGATSAYPGREHREGWTTERALEFLDRQRGADAPFLCYVSLDFPHAPSWVPPGWEDLYRLEDIPARPLAPAGARLREHHDYRGGAIRRGWEELPEAERRRATLRYYALCSFVDDCFGRILDRLRAIGAWEDTLVLWTSDHGEMLGDRNHRFSKYCLYEGAVRVPLLLGGGRVPVARRGGVDRQPAALVDVLPTLLNACGLPVPGGLPGCDLLGARRRSGSAAEFHGCGYDPRQEAPTLCWRSADWKLVLQTPGFSAEATERAHEATGELYDLQADPYELDDRWDDPAVLPVRERLTRELLMHLAGAWGRFPRQPTPVGL